MLKGGSMWGGGGGQYQSEGGSGYQTGKNKMKLMGRLAVCK